MAPNEGIAAESHRRRRKEKTKISLSALMGSHLHNSILLLSGCRPAGLPFPGEGTRRSGLVKWGAFRPLTTPFFFTSPGKHPCSSQLKARSTQIAGKLANFKQFGGRLTLRLMNKDRVTTFYRGALRLLNVAYRIV